MAPSSSILASNDGHDSSAAQNTVGEAVMGSARPSSSTMALPCPENPLLSLTTTAGASGRVSRSRATDLARSASDVRSSVPASTGTPASIATWREPDFDPSHTRSGRGP